MMGDRCRRIEGRSEIREISIYIGNRFFFTPRYFPPKSCIVEVQMKQPTGVSSVSWQPFVLPRSKCLVISFLFCPEEYSLVPDRPCFTSPWLHHLPLAALTS